MENRMFRTLKRKIKHFFHAFAYFREGLKQYEYDYTFLPQIIVFKLTLMGLYHARCREREDYKQVVRSIWLTRKYVRKMQNAGDVAWEKWREMDIEERLKENSFFSIENKIFEENGKKAIEVLLKNYYTWWD